MTIKIDKAVLRRLANSREAKAHVDKVSRKIVVRAVGRVGYDSGDLSESIDWNDATARGNVTVGSVVMGDGQAFYAHIEEFGSMYRNGTAPLRGAADALGLELR